MASTDLGVTRASLLSRARGRDSAAWRELVDLYGPLVAHWCQQCRIDSHSTADCVQEVFASVSRVLVNYRPQRLNGAFRAWLWTITANKIRDAIRAQRRGSRPVGGSSALRSLQALPDMDCVPDAEPTDVEQHTALLSRCMQQIECEFESRSWAIFRRSVVDQVATAIVADEFEVSAAAVRQTRCRILRRLRQQLGELE